MRGQIPEAAAAVPGSPADVSLRGQIPEAEAAAVLALVRAAADADGVGPLSEHVMLHLRYGGDPQARNLLLYSGAELAGYAHLDPTDPVEGPSGELVIHPGYRRRGLGLELTRALVAAAGQQPLRLWAHGDLPVASRLAAAAGFRRVRALWQMRRSLQARIDPPHVADGITIRTFAVGRDEEQWLAVNAAAFARHPEQGAWTRADLELREREPWFDPDGFFLAERAGKVVGFHWTKVHGRSTARAASAGTQPAGAGTTPASGGTTPASAGTQPAGAGTQPAAAGTTPASGGTQSASAGTQPAGAATQPAAAGTTPASGGTTPASAGTKSAGAGTQLADGGGPAPADGDGAAPGHGHEPIGEVYVVGIDPAERGNGLGRALTVIGLRYLRSIGLFQVMLYVDETNTAAIRLYESLGFTHWDTDVMFASSGQPG